MSVCVRVPLHGWPRDHGRGCGKCVFEFYASGHRHVVLSATVCGCDSSSPKWIDVCTSERVSTTAVPVCCTLVRDVGFV